MNKLAITKHLPLGLVVLMSCSLGDYELGPSALVNAPLVLRSSVTLLTTVFANLAARPAFKPANGERVFQTHYPVKEAEQCDGLDNNCNGQVDEGFYWKDPNTSVNIPVGQALHRKRRLLWHGRACNVRWDDRLSVRGTAILPDETWHTDKKNDSFDWNCNGKIEFGATNGSGIYKCVTHCEQISSDGECKSAVQHYSCDDIKKCGTMTSYGNSAYCRWDATNKTCSGSGTSSLEIICK